MAAGAVATSDGGGLAGDPKAGPGRDSPAEGRQQKVAPERVEQGERSARLRAREKDRALAAQAAWESCMRAERREIALRREGQLADALGEALPGESREALRMLAAEDQRQAAEGLVALMSNGRLSYKRLEELCEDDMPARGAAKRLRTTWLKERHDGWLAPGRG